MTIFACLIFASQSITTPYIQLAPTVIN